MKRNFQKMDKLLLVLMIGFCILGLVMVFSSSSVSALLRYKVSSDYFFKKQLTAMIVGFVVGLIVLGVNTKYYKLFGYLGIILSFIALVYVLYKGIVVHNAKSWLDLGLFKIQPIEYVKTIYIIFMAVYYNFLVQRNVKLLAPYFLPLGVAIVLAVLISLQPDLGGAAIILGISFFTFLSVPVVSSNIRKIIRILVVGAIIAVFSFFAFGQNILTSERLSRFNFQNPCSRYRDKDGSGYQVCNGFIAISNGGLLGLGLGRSTQKYLYLPDSHTDFIFPIVCEELGSLVGALVIIFYGLLLFRMYRIAKQADNLRTSILAYGAFWYFAMHILVNLLGVLALMPLTGVPLTFLSYGGSHIINAIVIIFILERVTIENKDDKLNRAIKSFK